MPTSWFLYWIDKKKKIIGLLSLNLCINSFPDQTVSIYSKLNCFFFSIPISPIFLPLSSLPCPHFPSKNILRNDLLMVCRQLNMEESVAEIMHQLGADENGKISFQDFSQCRMELVREIRKEEVELSVKSDDSCKKKKLRDRIASWPTSSNNSLGRYDF